MANHLFGYLLEIEDQTPNKEWTAGEIYARIPRIRSDLVVMSVRIPAYFDQLGLSELDDILTAASFVTTGAQMDHRCLVELDVLGAALGLPGCQTRLELRVLDAIKSMGLANPWKDYTS
ncbi:MAG: hypothetical protein ACRYF2_22930 [Janthinobacterium lividum]